MKVGEEVQKFDYETNQPDAQKTLHDEGSLDEGFLDEDSTEEGSPDEGSLEEGSPDEGSLDEDSLDKGSPDEDSTEEGSPDGNLLGRIMSGQLVCCMQWWCRTKATG